MPSHTQETAELEFHALTPERWDDLVALFEHHGDPGRCWCMIWRLASGDYRTLDPAGRRHALEGLVDDGVPVGVLAYVNGKPAGWCSIAPRESYARLQRSRTLKPPDAGPAWSVVCFYIERKARRQGLSLKLLQAAVRYAAEQGAKVIEGYPVEPQHSYKYMGSLTLFRRAGFAEAASTAAGRRVVRLVVGSPS